uniref:Fem-1 homolog A n=1 Tax=Gouania willdenowi TaxID=441366 RepID=A0A8C5H8N7_GOUWI
SASASSVRPIQTLRSTSATGEPCTPTRGTSNAASVFSCPSLKPSRTSTVHQGPLHHPAPHLPPGEVGVQPRAGAPEEAHSVPSSEAKPSRPQRLYSTPHGRGQGDHVGGSLPPVGRFPSQAVAALLLECGGHVDSRDSENNTPLHVAANNGCPEIIALLMKAGAHFDATNAQRKTAYELLEEQRLFYSEEQGCQTNFGSGAKYGPV